MTVACLGDYEAIVEELLDVIMESRLYERTTSIELAVLGDATAQATIDALIAPYPKVTVGYRSDDFTQFEFPALGLLQDACRVWTGDVFYLHTKGASRPRGDRYASAWRRLMVDYVVMEHELCRATLTTHDGVGTNWRGNHFSGNFWWARAEHIRKLPDIRGLRTAPVPLTADPGWNVRLQCEFWLAMRRGRFRNLGPEGLDLYWTMRWRSDAATVINLLLESGGGTRFLEIESMGISPYLGRVDAGVKDVLHAAVDPPGTPMPALPQDEAAYDVIFVDTWHGEDHCLAVLDWALGALRPGGAIVVHDTDPPTAWHQRPPEAFAEGAEWNGETWKAVVRFRDQHPEIDVTTIAVDWGCTVIRPSVPARARLSLGDEPLTWELLDARRDDLLGITSMRRFRRDLAAGPFEAGRTPIRSRTDILNVLISHLGLERYLEIGTGGGENFEGIIAPVRQSVDPGGSPSFRMSTNTFFAQRLGCPQYDVVLVDGNHEEEACSRDIENALERLSERGCIVVHDANPPTEWHQRPSSDVAEGSEWNGSVWRAVVRFRERHPDIALITLDVDWGCTVIRPAAPRPEPISWTAPADLTWAALEKNRRTLLNLVPASFAAIAAIDDAPGGTMPTGDRDGAPALPSRARRSAGSRGQAMTGTREAR